MFVVKHLIGLLLLIYASDLIAFGGAGVPATASKDPVATISSQPQSSVTNVQAPLQLMKNFTGKNEIKLLNNRFRIDYKIEEVMLLFFRVRGSAPVILVRPDGSKLYPRDADAKTLDWHDDISYDLIKLSNPMPGPWQALGKILPESKILVLSDVELQVDQLPQRFFQYERIKSEARIVNAGKMISEPNFGDVIRLKAKLYSTNDAEQLNFGAEIYKLGEFLDNGKKLDEKPRDGVFTVEYMISAETGFWLPKFKVEADLFTRELEQDRVEVLPQPISYSVQLAQGEERYHYVTIQIDDTHLIDESMIIQGKIYFPNGEFQTFSVGEMQSRTLEVFNSEPGTFRIEAEAFGKDKQGREFVLKVPEHPFAVDLSEKAKKLAEQQRQLEEQNTLEGDTKEEAETTPENAQEAPKKPFPIALVIIINLAILILGFLLLWVFVLKRDLPNPNKLLAKLKSLKPKKKSKDSQANGENSSGSGDILDLTLPKE